jgi:hypothetical protein
MPSNRELQIIMRVKDEATKVIDTVSKGIQHFSNEVGNLGASMVRMSRVVTHAGSSLLWLGASVTAPLIFAFKNAAEYSSSVSYQMDRMKNITALLQVQIATALVPVVEKIVNLFTALYKMYDQLSTAQKQMIVQTAFIAGLYVTLAGTIGNLAGKFLWLTGEALKAAKAVMSFALVNPEIFVLVGTVAVLTYAFIKLNGGIVRALNSLEGGMRIVAIGFYDSIAFIIGCIEKALSVFKMMFDFFGKFTENNNVVFSALMKGSAEFTNNICENLKSVREGFDLTAQQFSEKVVNMFQGENGSAAGWTKELIAGWHEFKNEIEHGTISVEPIFTWEAKMKEAVSEIARSASSTLGSGFFDFFTNQTKKAKDYFADFGRSILQILTQVAAQAVLFSTVGKALMSGFPSFFTKNPFAFHQGGIIRAHSGLAVDEVPIIAQTGEGILSRKGMSALGRSNFDRINRGEGVSGGNTQVTYNPVVVIKAWDAADVYAHSAEIQHILIEAIRGNNSLRTMIKQYC